MIGTILVGAIIAAGSCAIGISIGDRRRSTIVSVDTQTVRQATQIVSDWTSKQGHDRCWYYPELFNELAALLGIEARDPGLPSRQEFELGCRRYRAEQYAPKPPSNRDIR
jgi:hypothetical protein